MEAWKPSGKGQGPLDLDAFAMADLVMRSRSIPEDQPLQQFSEWQVQQRVDEQIAQLRESSRQKDQFLAMLSHELRTPLMPALMALDTLKSRDDLPADVRDLVNLIARNVRLEARLVDDLLDLTRVTRGKLRLNRQPTDAHVALRHALEVCATEIAAKQQHVRLVLDAPRATVLADAARLQQVFWNLLENAVKFTPARGTITCRTSCVDDRLRVDITDTGAGIDAELLPRIFDAFEQGAQAQSQPSGGLGLGLAIARGIVDAHGGKISVASDGKDRGATFTVELPLTLLNHTGEPRSDVPVAAPGNGHLRLLVVEDHPDTLRLLERLLHESGYAVTPAQDVKSAVDQLNHAAFDVLISDISLPDGSGHELVKQASAQNIKSIALTGHADESEQSAIQAVGFAACITKPIDFAKLKETIETVTKWSGAQ